MHDARNSDLRIACLQTMKVERLFIALDLEKKVLLKEYFAKWNDWQDTLPRKESEVSLLALRPMQTRKKGIPNFVSTMYITLMVIPTTIALSEIKI